LSGTSKKSCPSCGLMFSYLGTKKVDNESSLTCSFFWNDFDFEWPNSFFFDLAFMCIM
jgi:hypothetical protein